MNHTNIDNIIPKKFNIPHTYPLKSQKEERKECTN